MNLLENHPVLLAVIAALIAVAAQSLLALFRVRVLPTGDQAGAEPKEDDKKQARRRMLIIGGLDLVAVVALIGFAGMILSPGGAGGRLFGKSGAGMSLRDREDLRLAFLERGLVPGIERLQRVVPKLKDPVSRREVLASISELKGHILEDVYLRTADIRCEGVAVDSMISEGWLEESRYCAQYNFVVSLRGKGRHILRFPLTTKMRLDDLDKLVSRTSVSVGGGKTTEIERAVKVLSSSPNNTCYVEVPLSQQGSIGTRARVTMEYQDAQPEAFTLHDTDLRPFVGGVGFLSIRLHFRQPPGDIQSGIVEVRRGIEVVWSGNEGDWVVRRGQGPWRVGVHGVPRPADQWTLSWSRESPGISESPVVSFWQGRTSGAMARDKRGGEGRGSGG